VFCVPLDAECQSDEDCEDGEVCVAGQCVPDVECVTPADCDDENDCTANICADGVCENPNRDIDEMCDQDGGSVCDGQGDCVECNSDMQCGIGEVCTLNACVPDAECEIDAQCDDENDCTNDLCSEGECLNENELQGTACDQLGGTVCDGDGNCVACNGDADCDMGEVCVANQCVADVECMNNDECSLDEICVDNVCVSDPDVFCNEGLCATNDTAKDNCRQAFLACLAEEEANEEECLALGLTQCNVQCIVDGDCDAGEVCNNGTCELDAECVVDGDCDDGVDCTTNTCNAGVCEYPNAPIDTICAEGGIVCDGNGNCVECNAPSQCPPADVCQVPICIDGGCASTNDEDGADCDAGDGPGSGACMSGVCEARAEVLYEQNFESLVPAPQDQPTSLAEDGWLVGANVFAPDGTTFIRNYFAFAAPNGGPAFSAVATGQGGPDQGAQQMSIYSDYNNNGDHGASNIIEAVVFQERLVTADDLGTTLTFTFDAKRGNINSPTDPRCDGDGDNDTPNPPCDSTAEAFIQVLDSIGGSFATLAGDQVDTTNLPEVWGTFTLIVAIDGSLEGQTLQFGARNRATDFEPSGVFYDNMRVTRTQTAP
jgi:Cys-rich repeat protein